MKSKKTRIIDIARATGLSTATVDRVLNNRAGVSSETRKRVHQVLRDLEYSPTALRAQQMASKRSLEIVLSEGINPFFERLRLGFETALEPFNHANLDVKIGTFDPYRPSTVVDRLQAVAMSTDTVVTVGVDSLEVSEAINAIVDRGVRVVTVISDVPGSKRNAFIGQDNFLAGRTAARLMHEALRSENGSVAVLLGHLQFRHLLDRQSGFQQLMGTERADIEVFSSRPYGTDPKFAIQVIDDILNNHRDLRGLYLAGGGQPDLVAEIARQKHRDLVVIGHEATRVSQDHIKQGTFNFVLAHDVFEVGQKAVNAALCPTGIDETHCNVHIYVRETFPKIS